MNDGKKSLSILTAIQIIFFGLVVLTAVIIKLLGAPIYPAVERWYSEHLNDSILANAHPESEVSSQWSSAQVTQPVRSAPPESTPSSAPPPASQLGDVSKL